MAIPNGAIPFSGQIYVTDEGDTYALLDDKHIKGSYRIVEDETERDGITAERRKEGMVVYVLEDNKEYRLEGGIENEDWVELTGGGDSGGNPHIIGKGVDEDIVIVFDAGLDSNNSKIRYNHTSKKIEVSVDGKPFSEIATMADVVKYSIVFGK